MDSCSQSDDRCFYCGLPFDAVSLPVDDPLYKQFSKYAKKTSMRFYLPGKLEDEKGPQLVPAHSWCNCQARPLSHDDRLILKTTLSHHVKEQQCPPWQGLYTSKTDKLSKRTLKKQFKQELSIAVDRCYYCSMPFDVVPVEPGQPLYRKLKMWAKKTVEIDATGEETKAVLAHQWCRTKAAQGSEKEKMLLKTVLTAHCTGRETMPWVDKKLLQKFEILGGNTMKLIQQQDQALLEAGR